MLRIRVTVSEIDSLLEEVIEKFFYDIDTLTRENNQKTILKQESEIKKDLFKILYIFLRYIKKKTKSEILLHKLYHKISHLLTAVILFYNSG